MSSVRKWSLRLQPFELRNPEAVQVRFSYGKVESLLCLLAGGPGSFERDELGMALWPEASVSQRRVNLRQALYQLRATLGHDVVVANGTGCKLRSDFPLVVEASCANLAEEGPDEYRPAGPVTSFLEILRWYGEWDPGQMLELMRANRHLALGLRPTELHQVVELATKTLKLNNPMASWLPFWRAYERMGACEIGSARKLFLHSAQRGTECMDPILTVESLFWMGICDILLKKLDAAQKVVNYGEGYVSALNDRKLKATIDNLKAHVFIHQARTTEGIQLLLELDRKIEDCLLDRAQNEALVGLYYACAGETGPAQQMLEWPSRVAKETQHFRLQAICSLAQGYVALREGEATKAVALLEKVNDMARHAQSAHFQIYASEGSGLGLWQMNEKREAMGRLKSAKQLRSMISMAYTDWDQMRMRTILPAVRFA